MCNDCDIDFEEIEECKCECEFKEYSTADIISGPFICVCSKCGHNRGDKMNIERTKYWKWLREKCSEIQLDADGIKRVAFVIEIFFILFGGIVGIAWLGTINSFYILLYIPFAFFFWTGLIYYRDEYLG